MIKWETLQLTLPNVFVDLFGMTLKKLKKIV